MRYFHFLFWPVLVATFVVGFLQLKDQTYLQNDTAPHGIISLELGKDSARNNAIIQSWKSDTTDRSAVTLCQQNAPTINRLKKARTDVYVDYLFIVLYTLLGVIIITALQTHVRQLRQKSNHTFTFILIALALLAGIADCIEDAGMLHFIDDGINGKHTASNTTATITHISAYTKFAILIFLVGLYIPFTLIFRDNGLQRLSDYIRAKTLQLFRYRVMLIGVAFFALPIWAMDQGQDLLVNINSSDKGVVIFMAVVLIAAFLNWWLAKLFFEAIPVKERKDIFPLTERALQDQQQEKAEKKVSRFLGVATIIIPAFAILNALDVLHVHTWMDIFPSSLWLIGMLGIFFALIKNNAIEQLHLNLETKWGKARARNFVILVIVLLAVGLPSLIRVSVINGSSNTPPSLIFLLYHLVFLAFAFLVFVSVRGLIFKEDSLCGKRIGWIIVIPALLLAIAFILFNAFPKVIFTFDCTYLSLPTLLSGIILYILFITLLIRYSLFKKINFVLFVILTAIIVSITTDSDYHSVKTIDTTTPPTTTGLDSYFKQWLLKRKDEINGSKTYPVFFVNSYGGGVKAAAFTNLLVTYLDSVMIAQQPDHKSFEHYVFSFSGASGGTIGSAVQCAYRAHHPDSIGSYSTQHFIDFYKHDFLTPILGSMFGRDVWASITAQDHWDDRSAIQEQLWEGFAQRTPGMNTNLSIPFDSIWNTPQNSYEVPLLFSNTLNVDNGQKGICAPIVLERKDFPGAIFIRSRLDSINAHRGDAPMQTVSLMTGAFLSARFPFISPAGKMGPGFHFMDGGGKDNSGASTSEAIFIRLSKEMQQEHAAHPNSELDSLMQKVKFFFVSITNNPNFVVDPRKLVSNRWEPISPIVGIINSGITGNAIEADRTLQMRYPQNPLPNTFQSQYCSVWISGSCIEYGDKKKYEPVLPLGWQISENSVLRLRQSFDPDGLSDYGRNDGVPRIISIIKNR
ncbi:MAG: hypothetical protein JST68_05250 [Bacteroidetes bacterium]|nr:hypothetical protein [Bacteroidota bacterium]